MYKEYSDLIGIYYDDMIIGLVILANRPLNGKFSFIDLVIDEDYQHKGYGLLATKKIIEYFKNMSEAKVIKIEVFNKNLRAIKCYKKCGFKMTKECEWNSSFLEMEIVISH